MLKVLKFITVVGLLPLLLAGCLFGKEGYIHDRQQVYLQSQSEPGLKLPAGTKPENATPALQVPAGKSWSTDTAPSMLPPGEPQLYGAKAIKVTKARVTSASLGQDSKGFTSLKVKAGFAQTWADVNKAVTKIGYQVIGSDKSTGVIEVMSPAKKGQISDIYQFTLVQGNNATLISLLDQQGNPVANDQATTALQNLLKQLKI